MQEKSNFILNQEKTTSTTTTNTPKCKTSPNCDLSSVKKQLTQLNSKSTVQQQQRKLSAIIDSITFQNSPTSNEPNYLDQENRAPSEMSMCDSEDLITNSEMVETHESDDSASDTGAIVGNFWSNSRSANNNKSKTNGTNNKNKRKQSRPLRCSTYLRDRNNSLDSAIDLGDHTSKDSEEDEDEYGAQIVPQARNGCHVMEVATANGEENGNDYKYLMRSQAGLPCVFTIQPNALESDMDSPQHSDMESYVLSDRENGNGTPLSERDSDAEASTVAEALMDNVINIEPMNTESAAAAATKEQDELEPGEVLNLRARAMSAGGLSMVNRAAAQLQIPDLSSLTHSVSTNHNTSSSSLPAPLGRTPLRHRRTIGELYGLMNPQRRGRGGATNHIAMKYRRDCPIPGCGARYLTNLCDHLKKTHGLGPEERRPWLEKAKRIHQQKQLQEQQQQLQSPSGTNQGSNRSTSSPQSQRRSPSTTSSASNPTAAQAAQAAVMANLAASPALAAIALATTQSANLSSTDSIAMAMSQIPMNSAALLMQQAQALSLLNAQAFPSPNATFTGFNTAVNTQRGSAASSAFPSFSALGGNAGVTGSRVRSPWNSSGSRKNCPVPSCGAKSLLNLSDHLSKVHSMTRDERQPWLQRARDELA